jgi:MraZ protein
MSERKKNQRFRGASIVRLDGKGRLVIPTRYREGLSGEMVVTAHPHGCLMLFARRDFEALEKEVMARPGFEAGGRYYQEIIVGHADDARVDGAGRILLNAGLRVFAAIDKAVLMIGLRNRFHLWNEDKWRQFNEQMRAGEHIKGPPLPPGWESLTI